jgi:hypothetical protein
MRGTLSTTYLIRRITAEITEARVSLDPNPRSAPR